MLLELHSLAMEMSRIKAPSIGRDKTNDLEAFVYIDLMVDYLKCCLMT